MAGYVHVKRHYSNDDVDIQVHYSEHPDHEARFAMEMLEKWGMVTAIDGGEDSAGRAKLAPMPVPDLVQKACETSALAFEEFRKRGWMITVPSMDEAKNQVAMREDQEPKKKR